MTDAGEFYCQDDNTIKVYHTARERYQLECTCGQTFRVIGGETRVNNTAMDHVLEHDVAYEASLLGEDGEDDYYRHRSYGG